MDLKGQMFDEVGTNSDFISWTDMEQSIIQRTFLWLGWITALVFGVGYYVLGLMQSGAIDMSTYMWYYWLSFIGWLWLVVAISFGARKFNYMTLAIMFILFWLLEWFGLAGVFAAYNQASIINAFAGASIMFITMALWGYSTKTDLSKLGNLFLVWLISIIVISLLNVFIFKSSWLEMVISIFWIVLFLWLTAYDLQMLKRWAASWDRRLEIFFWLWLFLNFINIFLFLLSLFGGRD